MSRYPRYTSSTEPPATGHRQLRNPWISEQQQQLECRESQSTNSSSSSRTYHQHQQHRGPGPPSSLWLTHGHPEPPGAMISYNHQQLRSGGHFQPADQVEALVEGPHSSGPANPLLVHASGTAAITKSQHYSSSSRAPSDRDRPVTPASSPGGGSGGAVDGCGGHCVAFENFCYYCLQVIFIAGILTGVSLTIAGGVLRSQSRGGDLLVLVYIGCMIAMVCTLLLSVQCCVRRNVKRRKRALRTTREQRNAVTIGGGNRRSNPSHGDVIPLQDLTGNTPHQQQRIPPSQHQYQPLLVRLVQQQTTSMDNQRRSGNMTHLPYSLQPSFRRPKDEIKEWRKGTVVTD
ncbi:hypothetical protein L798_06424 [Zootermopsis nevadensis]|uniref:Uncharacterized protein n=1 Tax=Zootermopsis nevadensis TaxID=136037 RepID=A0A067R8Z1_ZOONE|nr:hypothetical protein L798_06424 [Zootermopsis nevadensis]